MNHFTLAAFSAESRVGAVALFRGLQLEDVRLRHLPIELPKAVGSVRALVTRILESYQPEFLVVTCPSGKSGDRVRTLCNTAMEIAATLGVPVQEVTDTTLMRSYGHPALTRKEHVRRVARTIWPGLNDARSRVAVLDSATAGLYFQTERLFSRYEVES